MGSDQRADLLRRQVARGGDAGDLELGRGRAEVRVEAAARGGDEVDGTGPWPPSCSTLAFTRSTRAALVGPRLEPLEAAAS